jgi:DNA polymerase III alpha subunit
MCAVLNNQGGFYSRMAYTEEVRRMGIPLRLPDVNRSVREFSCEGDAIRVGLNPVFELTTRTIDRIIKERTHRPFSDLYDFLKRTRAGEKEVRNLIKAGAMHSIDPSAPQLLLMNKVFFKNKKNKTVSEFVTGKTRLKPYNNYQKILNELEMLDCTVTDHPLYLFEDYLAGEDFLPSAQIENNKESTIRICGWLVTSRRVTTSNKQYMKFLTLEDRFGLFEVVLFSSVYAKYGHLIRTHGPYIITGKVQSRLPGEANLIADTVELVELKKTELESLLQRKEPPQWDGF